MAEKQRYTVSVPDHVSSELEKHAMAIGATPTEYAGDVLRWWFGQGCPPVRADENELRKRTASIQSKLKPVSESLNIWALNREGGYTITDDKIVKKLLDQLGLPNLFAHAAEHDAVRIAVAFDNHPTHWLQFDFFKGSTRKDGDGLAFVAYPKSTVSRSEMLAKMQQAAREMDSDQPFGFSQIPTPIIKKHEEAHH